MNTQIRIGHYSPDAPAVNVIVDGNTVLENVAFGDISDYLEIEAGSHGVDVVSATGGDTVIDTTLDLEEDTDYTVLAIGELASIRPLVLVDENRSVEDRTRVRFVHTSPDAPAVDVSVADEAPLFRDIGFGDASDYISVNASTYDVHVMPAGSDETVLSLSDVDLPSGRTVTVLATGLLENDTLDAQVVTDFEAHDVTAAASR